MWNPTYTGLKQPEEEGINFLINLSQFTFNEHTSKYNKKIFPVVITECEIMIGTAEFCRNTQNKAVGIATGYGMDDQGVGVRVILVTRSSWEFSFTAGPQWLQSFSRRSLNMNISAFWNTTPCCLVGSYQRFGGTLCSHCTFKKEGCRISSKSLYLPTRQVTILPLSTLQNCVQSRY
jgi:hypothetical protein